MPAVHMQDALVRTCSRLTAAELSITINVYDILVEFWGHVWIGC